MLKKNVMLLLGILCAHIALSSSEQNSSPQPAKDAPNMLHSTEYPTVHFFLNLLGVVNIIKGAAVQIPIVDVIAIDQELNIKRLITGACLILLSQVFRWIECRQHQAAAKKNIQPPAAVRHADQRLS